MRRRFFVERFQNGSACLQGDAAHHLGRVLRAESGQLFELSDGESVWLARTGRVTRDQIEFSLIEPIAVPRAVVNVTLLLSIVKFDRFEWAIEKATELGVDEIIPLAAERSEHGLIAAAAKRAERWRKILIESAQQSRRVRVPLLGELEKPREAWKASPSGIRLLLSERDGAAPMRDLLEPVAAQVNGLDPGDLPRVTLAIGPEGGWMDAEFAVAVACGFAEASLGANILRTETCVCAALAAVQYAFGAFRAEASATPPNEGKQWKVL